MPRTVARISPDVPLPPDAVFDQLCDVEKILRLNPHWICRNFAGAPAGQLRHGAEISVDVEDRLTGEIHRLRGVCSRYEPFSRLTLKYEGSTRLYTRFFIARGGEGSRITVEEVFSDKEDEEKFRWHHQQLEYWVHAIIEYLRLIGRTGLRASIARWLMDAVWIPGTPGSRRVSALVIKLVAIGPSLMGY
jgi:hypothetical protein